MAEKESYTALRILLLPMSPGAQVEQQCADRLENFFKSIDVEVEDILECVRLYIIDWVDSGSIDTKFKELVAEILSCAGGPEGSLLSEKYFDIHEKLVSKDFLSVSEARWFLTHAFKILDFAIYERFSCAQIARILSVRDERARFSRQNVGTFLAQMGKTPTLIDDDIRELIAEDAKEEPKKFADNSLSEAAKIVDEDGNNLGFPGCLEELLKVLANDEEHGRYVPYLQILHFQCSIAEYFDHAVTDFYEFVPRGAVAESLFEFYPPELSGAGNPFLNNAKSVEAVDIGWVRSKKPAQRPGAAALYEILSGLEVVGFTARRELARAIRLWVHRVVRFSKPNLIHLPDQLDGDHWNDFISVVKKGNTCTFGVMEQRLVDAFSVILYPAKNGWRSRGLGASVNTTNISQRKFGDCEYQNSGKKTIIAYESHGGRLTRVYVDEHVRTLSKIAFHRLQELEGVADVRDWRIVVRFVAHEIAIGERYEPVYIHGLKFCFDFFTFEELIETPGLAIDSAALNRYILEPLKLIKTPSEVRKRFQDIMM